MLRTVLAHEPGVRRRRRHLWGPRSAFAIGTDTESGQVRVVEVMSPQIRTEKGIHIGMPESDLYPLYPEIRRETMGAATVWIIDEVDPGSTTSAGIVLLEVVDDRVAHMRAIMRGIEPYSIARTDGYVIGECAD